MRVRRLIKFFEFEEKHRSKITLGTNVRLNPLNHRIQLEEINNVYSTDSDLYAKTWITNPKSVKQWLGFDVEATHFRDSSGIWLTSLAFRLSDGTNEYFWNGSSWEINTTDWNTEEEVSANIETFDVSTQKIQVVINLKTTDKNYTPLVSKIKILWASDVSFQEDIVVKSLIPTLREGIRPIADFPIEKETTSVSIDLNDFKLETPYNIKGIDSVFDHSNDPDHLSDLFQSYDEGTNVITLISSISAGDTAWVRFTYEPEVALTTSQEYTELDKLPQIILANLVTENRRQTASYDYVRNKGAGTVVKLPSPNLEDVRITLQFGTASQRDQQKLVEDIRDFFEDNPKVISRNLDEEYDIWHSEYVAQPFIGQKDIYSGTMEIVIKNVRFYSGQATDGYMVENMERNYVVN